MTPWDDNRTPDWVNPEGVKWWLDASTTRYARHEDVHGTTLDVRIYYTEHPDGARTRVMVDRGEAVYDDTSLEGMACRIDVMKANLRYIVDSV